MEDDSDEYSLFRCDASRRIKIVLACSAHPLRTHAVSTSEFSPPVAVERKTQWRFCNNFELGKERIS